VLDKAWRPYQKKVFTYCGAAIGVLLALYLGSEAAYTEVTFESSGFVANRWFGIGEKLIPYTDVLSVRTDTRSGSGAGGSRTSYDVIVVELKDSSSFKDDSPIEISSVQTDLAKLVIPELKTRMESAKGDGRP